MGKKPFFFIALTFCMAAASSPVIENGDFENDTTGWEFRLQSGAAGTLAVLPSDRPGAGNCGVVTVTTTGADFYYVQILQTELAISPSKTYTIAFYAKADAAKPFQLAFQKGVSDYSGTFKTVNLTTAWQQFKFTGLTRPSPDTLIPVQLAFSVGKNTGTFYFDDIQIIDEGRNITPIPDDWLIKANERIALHRKGDFTVTVRKSNAVMPSCSVKVDLKKNEFQWGTAIAISSNMDDNERRYRDTAKKYFNYGTFENVFKWSEMERTQNSPNYGEVNRYLAWADSAGWDLRGHTLIWGRTRDNHGMPSWTGSLSNAALIAACSTRVTREVTEYKGRLKEYDALNEPLHERWLDSTLGGDHAIYTRIFKWARAADPAAELYINEYNILEYSEKAGYVSLVDELVKAGAPIDGIGLQGHFTKRFVWKEVAQNLQYIADYGLPIKITECDINIGGIPEDTLAMLYATFMRIAFSHPSVNALVFWGFWESRHWRPNGAFFRSDWTKRVAADSLYHLVHREWSTHLSTVADASGNVAFNGFNGTYEIAVKDGAQWKVFPAPVVLSGKGTRSVGIDISSGTVELRNPSLDASSLVTGAFRDHIAVFDTRGRLVTRFDKAAGVRLIIAGNGKASLHGRTLLARGAYVVKVTGKRGAVVVPVLVMK
ncbi:MAG: endo-1,4-beta-xylanase [Chitinispirillaceae bacterium]|nr:endo-1,4-beta-xylanase [Chitinispirillaceae bacterium]